MPLGLAAAVDVAACKIVDDVGESLLWSRHPAASIMAKSSENRTGLRKSIIIL